MKAVILAGGAGSRLWPMSRDLKPKQFHSFLGKGTLLQETYRRLGFLQPEDIFISTNAQYEALVSKQLPKLPKDRIIVEPALRDTGPCICFAAHRLAEMGFHDEVMAIIYADHLIQKADVFEKTLQAAADHIQKTNGLGVIAVRAKYPNPNLGYIKIGRTVSTTKNGQEIYELDRFVEKPDLEKAKKFLGSFKYLWNTGLYLWKVKTILEKCEKMAPEIYHASMDAKTYRSAPKISIDYALMEKINPKDVCVFPAELGWNDIGNWAALHEELAESESANVSFGEHLGLDTEGSVILGKEGKLIVTYGLKNVIIVDTDEALLVMPKEKAAEAKQVIETLRKKKKTRFL